MRTNIIHKRDFLYEIDFDLGYDYQQVMDELKQQDWNLSSLGDKEHLNKRFQCDPQDGILRSILDYFRSEEWKEIIIDTLYSNPSFQGNWGPVGPKQMRDITNVGGSLTLDKSGFDTTIHVDNRSIIATAMCYLIDGDDPLQSTTFFTDRNGSNPIRMQTGFGKGWLCAGMQDAWHSGQNHGAVDRYSIMTGLYLKLN